VADLQAALAGGAPLIDVRTPGEFASGHVPGAKNIPLDELPARMGELGDPAAEVFVICEVGGRSAQAASSLAAAGRRAVNVKGGTRAWKAAGLPVE
jgi:rhodanese-related sulfurtransferase